MAGADEQEMYADQFRCYHLSVYFGIWDTAALEIIRREDFSHVFKFVKPDEHRLKYGELEVNEHWLDDIGGNFLLIETRFW